jgi:hypothetical protein
MSKLCTYILTKDTGLAPNPYWDFCTLAVCTPNRQGARLEDGDMIVGFRSKAQGHKLVFAMDVSEQMDMDDYFHDQRFQHKKPDLKGDWKQRCGDNFYSRNPDGTWRQHRNRFHIGADYLAKDTRRSNVFIAERFWYFGRGARDVPDELRGVVAGRGIRVNHPRKVVANFRDWVELLPTGIHGLPNDNPDVMTAADDV